MDQNPSPTRTGMIRRCVSFCFWLVMTGIAVTSLVVIGGNVFSNRVDSEIQARLVELIRQKYPNMRVRIRTTRRVEGKGIEVRGLSILGRNSRELVYVDELMLECDVAVTDLLSGSPLIRSVTARRMRVSGERNEKGKWNLSQFWPLSKSTGAGPMPPIQVVDGTIVLRDGVQSKVVQSSARTWIMRNVQFSLTTHANGDAHAEWKDKIQQPLFMDLKLSSEHFDEMVAYGIVDSRQGTWYAKGNVSGLRISQELLQMLPAKFKRQLGDARVAGDATVSFQANNSEEGIENSLVEAGVVSTFVVAPRPPVGLPFHFEVAAQVQNGRISDRRLPSMITDLGTRLFLDNGGLALRVERATMGAAQISANYQQRDWLSGGKAYFATIEVKDLMLSPEMAKGMPLAAATQWRKMAPVGRTHANVTFIHNGSALKTTATIELLDVAFFLPEFPYRLEHGSAILRLANGRLTAERFQAFASNQPVMFEVDLRNPGEQAVGTIKIRVPKPVPIDERLLAAFDPRTRDNVRAYHPQGGVSFLGIYQRSNPNVPFSEDIDVQLHNGSVQHDDFPYRMEEINGTLSYRQGRWTCGNIVCRNDSARVMVSGWWRDDSEQRAGQLNFDCRDVTLDEELRKAIAKVDPGFGRTWSELRPRGALDQLKVDYRWEGSSRNIVATAHKWSQEQNLYSRSVSVWPTWFPYRLERMSGTVVIKNGKVTLRKVQGFHNKTRVLLAGECQFSSNGTWNARFTDLSADKLTIDRALLQALPGDLAKSVEAMKLTGPIHLASDFAVWGGRTGPPRIRWRGRLALVNNDLVAGLPLKSVWGNASFLATTKGKSYSVTGDLRLESFMYRNVQVRELRGPYRLEPGLVTLGKHTAPASAAPLTARVFGGSAVGNAKIALNGTQPFVLDAQLRDGNMKKFATEMELGGREVRGVILGGIELQGELAQGYPKLRGRGILQVKKADLYEVPLVVALLSLLKVKRPDRNAFTDVNIPFAVRGDQLLVNEMIFRGGAVTLKGRGWMDFDRRINLTFFTLVGQDEIRIPILTSLFEEGSRRILEIQVVGTIDKPRIDRRAFPELDDTLRRIFPNYKQPKRTRTTGRFRFLNPRAWTPK